MLLASETLVALPFARVVVVAEMAEAETMPTDILEDGLDEPRGPAGRISKYPEVFVLCRM